MQPDLLLQSAWHRASGMPWLEALGLHLLCMLFQAHEVWHEIVHNMLLGKVGRLESKDYSYGMFHYYWNTPFWPI